MADEQGKPQPPQSPQNSGAQNPRADQNQRGGNRRVADVAPFCVEFGDIYNRNMTIATFRLKVRGNFALTKMHKRPEGGRDVGSKMTSMPEIPGQRLRVIPRDKSCCLFDPLEDDPDLMERVNTALKKALITRSASGGNKPVPKMQLRCTDDQMKTLCAELLRMKESGSLTIVEGELPTSEQVDAMPGRELYDCWNNNPRKPKYKDQVDEYVATIEKGDY